MNKQNGNIQVYDENNISNINIGYKPSIAYEDSYYSEKQQKKDITLIAPELENNKLDILDELVDDLELLIDGLPGGIQDMINNVFEPVKDFYEENKDFINGDNDDKDFTSPSEDPTDPEDPDDKKNPFENDPDFIADDNFEPVVNIIKEEILLVEYLENKYKENMINLFEDYFNKLLKVLNNYWAIVASVALGKTKDFKMFLSSDIQSSFKVDSKKQHILDLAMRSQIHRQQKASFASKNFALDETIVKLRTFKMNTELMLRYIKTEDIDAYTSRETEDSFKILEACMINYNSKYNSCYADLYKYLNSSTIISDNVLQLMSQEVKIKQYLK